MKVFRLMLLLVTAVMATAICGSSSVRPGDKTALGDGWTLQCADGGQIYSATVPSTVAGVLYANGVITDNDFLDDNYRNIDRTRFDKPWTYTKQFSGKGMAGKHVFLQNSGLKTLLSVFSTATRWI